MRTFYAIAVLVFALGTARPAVAVNELLTPSDEQGFALMSHSVKPSMRARLQLDDNVTSSKPKDEVWTGIVGPKVAFKLPYEHSYMGGSAEYVGRYYGNRIGPDSVDNDAFLETVFRHDFSGRLSAGVKQYFAFQEQPNVVMPVTPNFQSLKTLDEKADYALFVNSTGITYRFNKRLTGSFSHDVEILDFSSHNDLVPSSLNIMQNRLSVDANYRLWDTTILGAGYRFTTGDYETVDKDYEAHLLSLILRHRIARHAIFYARAGFERRAPDQEKFLLVGNTDTVATPNDIGGKDVSGANNKNRTTEPWIEVDMTYLFTQATQLKVGYKLRMENTEQPAFYNRKVQGVYGSLAHKLTRKTQLLLFASQQKSSHRNNRVFDAVTPVDENLFKFGVLMTQQIRPWMFLELGYRYTDQLSQFSPEGFEGNTVRATQFANGSANTDYTRNRVFSGLHLTF